MNILPLGDSITEGFRSSDGNGYRLTLLRTLLRGGYSDVAYVGSLHSGNMSDNAHEGHGGYTIARVAAAFGEYVGPQPGVVLVHVGTNDMNISPSVPIEVALRRLGGLIDMILRRYRGVTVIVAGIIQSSFEGTRERIGEFDSKVPGVVGARADGGYKVLFADMSDIGAHGEDLADGLHPDDRGYVRMAGVWYSALEEAASKGWISPPDRASDVAGVKVTAIDGR